MSSNIDDDGGACGRGSSRRNFLKRTGMLAALAVTPGAVVQAAEQHQDEGVAGLFEKVPVILHVNGKARELRLEPRTTLLDALREHLFLTGTKKGCDRGQCGACTVHVDGRRINSCLSLAISNQGREITTIEGLADGEKLHAVQEAFIRHDGFQCGYCTPGQIMSAVALLREGRAGNADEVREFMSGNICRCGAYPNIVKAILDAKSRAGKA